VKEAKPEEQQQQQQTLPTQPQPQHDGEEMDEDVQEGPTLIEDLEDETGGVWCMEQGRVVNWRAFFALL
jgi:hypothetical protein